MYWGVFLPVSALPVIMETIIPIAFTSFTLEFNKVDPS